MHTFVAPFYERSWLKFHPNLAPNNLEEISSSDGEYKKDVPHLTWPHIAHLPPPEIGQRRNSIGWATPWMGFGRWEPLTFSGAESWVLSLKNRLQEQVKQSEKEFTDCENKWCQLLAEQKEIEDQHYKTAHHREYLGEQPVKDQQVSYRGEYSRITDVQWFDYTEELDQTSDQRRDEIAGEIAMLPDYVARVKIKDENDGFIEYSIRTLKPERGLPEKALDERIARIKETMIGNKIIRPKHVIDEEIRKRHQALRRPQLEPPHKQGVLLPPDDEPPITRRQQA